MGKYSTRRGRQPRDSGWVIQYGGIQVECRDEADAKALAARLRKKGHRFWARTCSNTTPARFVDTDEISSWLQE